MPTQEDAKHWEKLHHDWLIANQAARKARLELCGAFADCAAGRGAGPSVKQIDEVERLERAADAARLTADQFIRQVFGR